MHHIVNISGGAASAVCLFRVLERYGRENVRAVFADTRSEHPDCYRFLDDVERVSGVPLDRLSDGRNIWDCFLKAGQLHTTKGGCVASWQLKRKPLEFYTAAISGDVTVYVGFGPDEDDRQARLKRALPDRKLDFPLTWQPMLSRCDVMDDLKARGIEPPSMYAEGYPHANCAGGCILAGIKQWAGLLKDNPELYRTSEENENKIQATMTKRGREKFTILRDRRGGVVTCYSLRQLREDIESGRRLADDSWRETSCSCMLW
jgi:3'-phosphoadenosine 5'-phosphosulfate sulfotransferase (PAPS reductase)/FAD synthetase